MQHACTCSLESAHSSAGNLRLITLPSLLGKGPGLYENSKKEHAVKVLGNVQGGRKYA